MTVELRRYSLASEMLQHRDDIKVTFSSFFTHFLWNVPLGSHVRPLEQWDGRDRPEFGRAKGQRLVDTSARGEIGL